MAIAQRQVSVTRGYKEKAKRVERREPNVLQRVVRSLRTNAREISAYVADEIVYATMDTLRVLNYLRYELGFKTRARVEPVVHELTKERGAWSVEW